MRNSSDSNRHGTTIHCDRMDTEYRHHWSGSNGTCRYMVFGEIWIQEVCCHVKQFVQTVDHFTDCESVSADMLTAAEQETYGVDWDALHDHNTITSHLEDSQITEESSPWLEAAGAPPLERLNTVEVEPPITALTPEQSSALLAYLQPVVNATNMPSRTQCWNSALSYVQSRHTPF
jgi:hypothetical protein